MPRHLTESQIGMALKRGKSVEQFLGSIGDGRIAWLELRPASDAIEIWRFEVFDDGDEGFLDLYSFTPTEDDWPEVPGAIATGASEALQIAASDFGADREQWVNQFVIQDEYRDFVVATK